MNNNAVQDNRPARLLRGHQYCLLKSVRTAGGIAIPAGTKVVYRGSHRDQIGFVPGSQCCTVTFVDRKEYWPMEFHPLKYLLGEVNDG